MIDSRFSTGFWSYAQLGPNDPGDIGKHGRSETGPRQLSVELRQTAVKPVTVRLGP